MYIAKDKILRLERAHGHLPAHFVRQPYFPSIRLALTRANASGKESAEARAFQRFLKNRIKQLGTFLPPSPDAPEPDTALLWNFLSRQLAEGISNDAEVLPRAQIVVSSGEAAPGSGAKSGTAAAGTARRGVVIPQPRPFPDARRSVPCPLPIWVTATTADGLGHSKAALHGGMAGAASPPPALVHVFWDIDSAHPGNRDPRLVAVEVLRLAGHMGRVVGRYAYGTRPAWAWVPSAFVRAYAQNTNDEGDDGSSKDGNGEDGSSGTTAQRRVRCPVCGRKLTPAFLEQHLQTLHPDKPAASLAATAIAEHEQKQQLQQALDVNPLVGSRPRVAALAEPTKAAKTNSYRTGLGAVQEYYSSSGEVFRPPAGHQLGLKYVIQREGFEPRVAQNADAASDRALNGGVDRLLSTMRGGAASGAGRRLRVGAELSSPLAELPHTLVLLSGSRRHAEALSGCRRLGVRTVVVAAGPGVVEDAGQVDAVLSWEVLAGGSYRI